MLEGKSGKLNFSITYPILIHQSNMSGKVKAIRFCMNKITIYIINANG